MDIFSIDKTSRSKSEDTRMRSLSKPHYATSVEGGSAANRDDSDSQNSRTQIIKETRTFAVESFPDVHDTVPDRSNEVYQV